jgi:hypothetical protein
MTQQNAQAIENAEGIDLSGGCQHDPLLEALVPNSRFEVPPVEFTYRNH